MHFCENLVFCELVEGCQLLKIANPGIILETICTNASVITEKVPSVFSSKPITTNKIIYPAIWLLRFYNFQGYVIHKHWRTQ